MLWDQIDVIGSLYGQLIGLQTSQGLEIQCQDSFWEHLNLYYSLHASIQNLRASVDTMTLQDLTMQASHPVIPPMAAWCLKGKQDQSPWDSLVKGELLSPSCALLFLSTVKTTLESHTGMEFTDRTG